MPVFVTGIHAFVAAQEGMDARDEREHDGEGVGKSQLTPNPDSNGSKPWELSKPVRGSARR
jgi:hypothetical protein